MSFLDALFSKWRSVARARFKGDWHYVHFVAGPRVPGKARGKFQGGREPLRLPDHAMPGFSVVGCLYKSGYRPRMVGQATLVVEGREDTRELPDLPYFQVYLYPEIAGGASPQELWARATRQLPTLFTQALLRVLEWDDWGFFAEPSAQGRMAVLKSQPRLDPGDSALLARLEAMPIFGDCHFPGDGPVRWSLHQLAQMPMICLLSFLDGYKLRGRRRRPNVLFFAESQELSQLCDLYSLPVAEGDVAREETERALETFISSDEQNAARQVAFALLKMIGPSRVEVGLPSSAVLTIDLDKRVLSGPDAQGAVVEMPFDAVRRLDIEETEISGDTKVHRYFHLVLSDGIRTLAYYDRYPEYYEGGRAQNQLDDEHFKSQVRLHAIAAAIDCKAARLQRLDLLPRKDLLELARE